MVFVDLINNVALALALTIVLGLVWKRRSVEDLAAQILAGVIFGAVTVAAMMNPLRFSPGIISDIHSIFLSLAGLFAGPVAAALSAAAAAAFRLIQGGPGVGTGVGTILTSAGIGVVFYYLAPRKRTTRPVFLLLFGFVVQAAVLAWTMTLPWARAWTPLLRVAGPMFTLYPMGSLAMGLLLAGQYRRSRAEGAPSASEKQYRALAEGVSDVFFALDRDLRYTYWNRAAEELTGVPADRALGQTLYQLWPDVRGTEVEEKFLGALRTGRPVVFENDYLAAGRDVGLETRVYPSPDGLVVLIEDVTARQRHESKLHRINRARLLQSAVNQALVDARDEADFLREMCRLIVDVGEYRFAWVGLAEADEGRTVRPAASWGLDEGYLESADITWDDTEHGRGPTGTAIRTGETVVCRDVESNGSYGPWRTAAVERGLASSVALPLISEGLVFGALNIYAAEPDAFDEEELRLLSETASDLAYGVTAIRSGDRRLEAEGEVLMFQGLIDQSSDAMYVTDGTTGRILYVNDQACQDLGYTRDELLRMSVRDIDPNVPDDEARQQEFIRALEMKRQLRVESEHRRRDGSTFPVELSIKAVVRRGQRFGVVIARDITERRGADEALRLSEERFREAFESANVGMALVSPEGYFLKTNAVLSEMLGYSAEEFLTKTFNDVTLPEDHHISLEFQRRAMAGETSQAQFEKRYQHKSGRIVWGQVSSSLLRGARGEPLHFVAHIVDITERVRAVAALAASEELYQSLFNNMLNGFAYCRMIYDQDRPEDFVYLAVNQAFENQTGLKNVVGKRVTEVIPGIREADPGLFEIYGRVAKTGRPESFEVFVEALQMWFFISVYGPKPDHFVAVFDVITERKRAEEALRQSEVKYRQVVNNANDGIVVIRDGVIVFGNTRAAEMSERPLDQLIGSSIFDLVHPDDSDLARENYRKRFAGEPVADRPRYRTTLWPNEPGWVEVSGALIEWEGQPANLAFISDVTQRVQAEQALRESEARFRELFDGISDWICVHDLDGRLLGVNPAVSQASGYRVDELVGRPISDFLLPEHRSQFEDLYLPYLKEKGRFEGVFKVKAKDGTVRYIEYNSTLVTTEDREPFVSGVGRDVTERRLTDRALRRSEEQYRLVVDHAHEGICIIQDGIIKFANPKLVEISGYTPGEAGAKPFIEFIHPDDRPAVWERYQQQLAGGGLPQAQQYRLIHRDGRIRWIDVISISIDWQDRPATLNFMSDITERKQAEDELARSFSLMETTLESTAGGILVVDQAGRIERTNQRFVEMWGLPESLSAGGQYGPVIEFCARQTVDPQGFSTGADLAAAALDGERRDTVHLADGRVLERSSWPRRMGEDVVGLVWSFQDVTERMELESQFLQAQKMEAVGRLAGSVAHDFNNLLTIITGYGELVLQQLGPDDPRRKEIEEMRNAGVRAAALTRQLLAFSRRQILEPRVLEMNFVVSDLENMLRRLIGEDIELRIKLDPAAGQVNVDPGQLEQVILNLAVNARDAMPQGGHLTIETGPVVLDSDYIGGELDVRPGPYVMLAISDSGTGMDDEVRANIFDPFFTTKATGKGTGLGLSTVFGIIKQSGGDIHVYSKLERGTTFRIYLPRTDVEGSDSAPPRKTAEGASGTETILLVEDEAGLRKFVNRVLEKKGYRVVAAASGAEALTLLERHQGPLHLLLTDVVMPGMSGKELADRVQAVRPDIKIIFTSGYTDDAIAHHGVLDSDFNFISKPFTAGDLTKKIRAVLDG